MDRAEAPSVTNKPPTSSADPHQQRAPDQPAATDTKNISAHDTVSTGTDGTAGARPNATDGPKDPDPSAHGGKGGSGTGTEYDTHMKGTAAPGSHSELFGLTPGEGKVHPPPGSGAGSGVLGTSGHRGTHSGGAGSTAGTASGGGNEGPSLLNKLNPMSDADGDGKKGVQD
jgi:hypothetical protein